MSEIVPIQIIQNDYGYQIPFTLQDGNGNAYNLTGSTLSINVQNILDTTMSLALNGSMAIDNPTAGTCHYTVAIGDFTVPGSYIFQIQATYSGIVVTWPVCSLIVNPELPQNQPWTEN